MLDNLRSEWIDDTCKTKDGKAACVRCRPEAIQACARFYDEHAASYEDDL